MNSPFQCGGVVKDLPAIPPGKKLVVRIDKTSGATLKVKKNGDPTTHYDFLLYEGEFVEISERAAVVSVLNAGANPNVIWTFEPLEAHRP